MKKQKGITLVALVITIIVLLILAGISIQTLTNQGIFAQAQNAKKESEIANIKEQIQLDIYQQQLEPPLGSITEAELEAILAEYGTVNYEEDGTIIGITTEKGYVILLSDIYSGITEETKTLLADGSWNSSKQVNSPKLMTGMTGIYWDEEGNEVIVTAENQDNWYDYSNQKWANAITEDGSYWVWIPRYAYQITSNCNTSTAGTIVVKFLQGRTNKDANGNEISTTYPTVTNNAMTDFVVHPCFTDGSKTEEEIANGAIPFGNGEWDEDIPGFWVAKYVAGFQECTQTVSSTGTVTEPTINTANVKYSDEYFTSYNDNYKTNALSQTLTSSGYSSQKISYPVFKPLTYVYNVIGIGDSYTISQEIAKASSFYGLSETETDSHQMKNSEWGAVEYLTQSSYGRNGNEITVNSKNLNNLNSKIIYAVTGYAESTANGVGASSTNNKTGVFDLIGCTWERTSAYISNGNSNLSTYGDSYTSATANVNGYKVLSTKWVTVYPYNSSSDSNSNNWTVYNGLKSSTYGFGDAILETSASGSEKTSWNGGYSSFPFASNPFFRCGGDYGSSFSDSSFAFLVTGGHPDENAGFRAVLVGK